jgi:hypothetical protein
MMKLGCSKASLLDPANSAEITITIEEALECDGSECRAAMPGDNGELELLSPHWHVTEKGRSPEAGPRIHPVMF